MDGDEDQKIAYQLLHNYKKDKNFIKKDLEKLKSKSKKVYENIEGKEAKTKVSKPPSATVQDDVVLRMEIRHQDLKEQKAKRRREIMLKKEEESKQRQAENRVLKANFDLQGILVDEPKPSKRRLLKAEVAAKPSDMLVSEMPSSYGYEDRLEEMRKKRESYAAECQQYSEDVTKIKEMVRKEVEEQKKLDRMQKFQHIEKERKKELEAERRRLEQERVSAQKEIRRFRANKMYNVLNNMFIYEQRRRKKQYFSSICTYTLELENKVKRSLLDRHFRLKNMFYQAWRKLAHKQAQDKLFLQYKQEQIKEKVNMERAAHHDNTETQRKAFQSMRSWIEIVKEEKMIAQEHDRKLQVFLDSMKKKTEEQKARDNLVEINNEMVVGSNHRNNRIDDLNLEDEEDKMQSSNIPLNINISQNSNNERSISQEDQDYSANNEAVNQTELLEELKMSNEQNEEVKVAHESINSLTHSNDKYETPSKEQSPPQMALNKEETKNGSTQKRLKWSNKKETSSKRPPSITPKMNNPVINKMQAREEERQKRKSEILKKKQQLQQEQQQEEDQLKRQQVPPYFSCLGGRNQAAEEAGGQAIQREKA